MLKQFRILIKEASENPFIIHQDHINWLQILAYILLVIISPVMIVYRILGFILIIISFDIAGRILLLTLPKFPQQYTDKQQERVERFFKAFGVACCILQGLFVIKRGRKIDKKKDKIFVANHTTMNDATINCLILPTKMIAKSSLSNFPVFRTFFTLQRAILIERPDSHLKENCKYLKPQNKTSTQYISESLKDKNTRISVCPEGTIAAPGIVMRFHTSVFLQGYPVVPVCVKYYTFLPTAWTTDHWLFVLFNSLVNPFGLCVVDILEPQTIKEGETYQQFADRVGQMIADKLHYKYVPYQSKDWFYFSGQNVKPTDEYLQDFGWMGTLDQFYGLVLNHIKLNILNQKKFSDYFQLLQYFHSFQMFDRQIRSIGLDTNQKLQQLQIQLICDKEYQQDILIKEIIKHLSLVGVQKIFIPTYFQNQLINVTSISEINYTNQIQNQTFKLYIQTNDKDSITYSYENKYIKIQTTQLKELQQIFIANIFMYCLLQSIKNEKKNFSIKPDINQLKNYYQPRPDYQIGPAVQLQRTQGAVEAKLSEDQRFVQLAEDNQNIKHRTCKSKGFIVLPFIELALIGIFGYFSFKDGFNKPKELGSSFQVLTSKSDLLQRQCGFDNTKVRYDLSSPNILKVVDKIEDENNSNNPNKTQVVQLCQEMIKVYNKNTSWNFQCSSMIKDGQTIDQQQYNNFTTNIYNQLPQVGRIAVYSETGGIICQNKEEDSCPVGSSESEAYLCLQEFFDITRNNGITLADKNQVISQIDFNNTRDQLETLNLSFLTNMCKNIQTSTYNYQKFDNFSVCTIDVTNSVEKMINSYIEIPAYIEYLIKYFMQFSSNFVSEFQKQWKSICFSTVSAIVYSYAAGLIIRYAAKTVMTLSSFLPGIIVAFLVYLLSTYIHKNYNDETQNFMLFGYNKLNQYFAFGVLLIIDIILALIIAGSSVLIYQSLSQKNQQANMIKICAPIIRKRFRMKFLPILLIIIMTGLAFGILYAIFLTIYNTSFDGSLSISSFEYMTKDYIIKKDIFKILFIVVLTITGIHMIFFITQTNRYLISNLTYQYYFQRISSQFNLARVNHIKKLQNDSSKRNYMQRTYAKALKIKKRELQREAEKQRRIEIGDPQAKLSRADRIEIRNSIQQQMNTDQDQQQSYFDIGLQTGYIDANLNYFRQIGIIFLISFLQVILFIPKIFLMVLEWINSKARLQRFKEQKILDQQDQIARGQTSQKSGCCNRQKQAEQSTIEKILSTIDKKTLYYCSLTGCTYKTGIKHSSYLYIQNATLINNEEKVTKVICVSFKFIIVICANITWALLLQKLKFLDGNPEEQQSYNLTPFIAVTILSFIIITNLSMLYAFNFENMLTREGKITLSKMQEEELKRQYKLDVLPEDIKKEKIQINVKLLPSVLAEIIYKQHLQDPNKVFDYKDTFNTIVMQ